MINPDQANDFEGRFNSWLTACQNLLNQDFKQNYPNLPIPLLVPSYGQKRIRIVRDDGVSRSAWAFIDLSNGDVLKPASYNAPAKHARGNIFDENNGMLYMTAYGPNYLR